MADAAEGPPPPRKRAGGTRRPRGSPPGQGDAQPRSQPAGALPPGEPAARKPRPRKPAAGRRSGGLRGDLGVESAPAGAQPGPPAGSRPVEVAPVEVAPTLPAPGGPTAVAPDPGLAPPAAPAGDPLQPGVSLRPRRRRGRRGGRRHRRRGAEGSPPAAVMPEVSAPPVPGVSAPPAAVMPAPPVAGVPAPPVAEVSEPAAAGTAGRRRRRSGRGGRPPVAARPPQGAQNVADFAAEYGLAVAEVRWFRQALYHASYVNERGSPGISSNERLEFLGDAVLDLAVGQYLFERYPDMAEGDLSRLRAAVVRASTLATRAKAMGLGRYALLGKGEERSGGRRRPNFLADLFEAVVGAIFLDQGIGAATDFVLTALRPDLEAAAEGYEHANYKAQLQDAVQKEGHLPVTYTVLSAVGPQHARVWQCEVRIGGRHSGLGNGRTKRAAEQEAARDALLRGWNHA